MERVDPLEAEVDEARDARVLAPTARLDHGLLPPLSEL